MAKSKNPLPTKSGRNARIGNANGPFAKMKGGGKIGTTRKDFSKSPGERRAQTIMYSLAFIPFLLICGLLLKEGFGILAAVLFATPIVMFFIFWKLSKI